MANEVKYSSKLAETLRSHTLESLFWPHQSTRSLLCEHEPANSVSDTTYLRNDDFWHDVINEDLRAPEVVKLEHFRIFEWIPRNPGLFHTYYAGARRQAAFQHISDVRGRPDLFMQMAEALPDHATGDVTGTLTLGEKADRLEIFNPFGKMSMLEGGIGCVRLRPIYLGGKEDQEFFVFSATSSQSADEGIPILVSSELVDALIVPRQRLVGRLC